MNHTIKQNFKVQFNYTILFSENIFSSTKEQLADILISSDKNKPSKAIVIIDEEMFSFHPNLIDRIKAYFIAYQDKITLEGTPLLVAGGEKTKNNWDSVENVLDLINTQKIDRHSYVIAIGGGAVLDMVGFACAIAHRGVRLIRVPTTVLSQNDSGVGVKNSVNYYNKKNFLGTFQPPYAVINDRTFLTTLSDRDWRSGISEAIKVALIKDRLFFEWIEKNTGALTERNLEVMNQLIYKCAQMHVEHIGKNGDPFEQGSSRPLDFGHWAAHKLEYLTNYEVTHGEAVAIGIALDACYSHIVGYLDENDLYRILHCFDALGFELYHPLLFDRNQVNMINPELIKGLEEFREHLGGVLTIMLLDQIGKGKEVHSIDEEKLQTSVAYLAAFHKVKNTVA